DSRLGENRKTRHEDQATISTKKSLLPEFINTFRTITGPDYNIIPARNVNLITAEDAPVNPDLLSQSHLYDHVILREFAKTRESANYYCDMVVDWICDGISAKATSLQTIQQVRITHSDQKQFVLEKVHDFLVRETIFQERMINTIVTAVDELLMNAVYDAPEERLKVSFPRETSFSLTRENSVELMIRKEGDWVSFTVIDHHGSVDRGKLMCRLFKNRYFDTGTLDFDKGDEGGAGIGLAQTLRKGGSLTFFCKKGVRTEVTVAFRMVHSYREFKSQFRAVSIYHC
ncbi:hypothetical protein K2X30_00665, partial [bacterium]|nr:hypothetical protein [bacterium]